MIVSNHNVISIEPYAPKNIPKRNYVVYLVENFFNNLEKKRKNGAVKCRLLVNMLQSFKGFKIILFSQIRITPEGPSSLIY